MIKANYNFKQLSQNYLFAEIARRVAQYKGNNPEKHVISLGIGDVTRPLVPEVIKAMHKAVDDEEMPQLSTVTVLNRAMIFCAIRFLISTTSNTALT